MKILVLNSGSSSVKYSLFEDENLISRGIVDRIGLSGSVENHEKAIKLVLDTLVKENKIKSFNEIDAVGHRVVHGGEEFKQPVIVDKRVIKVLKKYSKLAPLHNPLNILGIEICQKLLKCTQAAVFDTAFFHTLEEKAFIYALPYSYYKDDGIRRYGFHGTSHKYVVNKAREILGRDDLKIISCHLGNGCSMVAVDKGKAVDVSLGLTPLEGLVMGTRSGDIDPAIIRFLMDNKGLTIEEIDDILNKKSGLLGISGISSDMSDLVQSNDERAKLAIDIFCYRVQKYIGAYIAALQGADVIAFTAGIGEKSWLVREKVLKNFRFLGLKIDDKKNRNNETLITTEDSKIKVLVIPTDEELMIAKECLKLVV